MVETSNTELCEQEKKLTILGNKVLELLEVEFLLRASGTHCDDVNLRMCQ